MISDMDLYLGFVTRSGDGASADWLLDPGGEKLEEKLCDPRMAVELGDVGI